MTCFNQGDSEPPGHSGNEHPITEDKPMDEQLDKNNTAEEHNAPTTLQMLLIIIFKLSTLFPPLEDDFKR